MFNIDTYDYNLPKALIAQEPLKERDSSRLMYLRRETGDISEHIFKELPDLLEERDTIVINDTRVIPAKIIGKKPTGGRVEILILNEPIDDKGLRLCLIKSSKRMKGGQRIDLDGEMEAEVEESLGDGFYKLRFSGNLSIDEFLRYKGLMPIPPYIKRREKDKRDRLDRERYQTIFAKKDGSIAAPTAGLHFSEYVINKLKSKGIAIYPITLHVGYGTFKPIRCRDIRNYKLPGEYYKIDKRVAEGINERKKKGGRIIAVGTTVVRALESVADKSGKIRHGEGVTELFIYPSYRFKIVDGMITNFHLPRSSLLLLVCAFAGVELIKRAYGLAIEKRYRFYSYGDAMLII